MYEQGDAASKTQLFISSLAHLPEMFLKITWNNCNIREESGSDTLFPVARRILLPLLLEIYLSAILLSDA
jgi:hypothetical protein